MRFGCKSKFALLLLALSGAIGGAALVAFLTPAHVESLLNAGAERAQHIRIWLGVIAALCLLVLIPLAILMQRRLLSSLHGLRAAARLVSRGELSCELPPRKPGGDELDKLNSDFHDMILGLRESTLSSEFMGEVMGSMSEMLFVLESDGVIRSCNHSAEQILGYDEGELAGKHLSLLMPEVLPGLFLAPESLNGVLLGQGEKTLSRKNGEETRVFFAAGLLGHNDKCDAYVCIARDLRREQRITEEKKLGEDISHLLLTATNLDRICRQVANTLSERLAFPMVAVALYDEASRSFDFRGSVGLPLMPEELELVPVENTLAGRVLSSERPELKLALPESDGMTLLWGVKARMVLCLPLRVEGRSIGVLLLAGSGQQQAQESVMTLLQFIADNIGQAIIRLENENTLSIQAKVLKERNLELRLERDSAVDSDLNKSEFMSVISHELRTSMNGIMGMTDLLLQESPTSSQMEHLTLLCRSADGLLQIVNDILDFSSMEAGELRIKTQPFDLHELLGDVGELLSEKVETKGLNLLVDVDPDMPRLLYGDPAHIRHVLLNLGNNAVEFTGKGQVRIAGMSGGMDGARHRIRMSVTDSGPGIDADDLNRFLDDPRTGEAPAGESQIAAGLGLRISAQLVGLMGGKLKALSRQGSGSEFFFTLPLSSAEQLAPSDEAARSEDDEARITASILVVEDDKTSQRLAQMMLKKIGCRVEVASHGHQALEMLAAGDYDMVFMDWMMPVLDGLEATRLIRDMDGPVSRVPIIALTANAMEADREKVLAAGMDDYMSKPINSRTLRSMLRRWISSGQEVEIA